MYTVDALAAFSAIEGKVAEVYERFAQSCHYDPHTARFWQEMAREERAHAQILKAEQEVFKVDDDPGPNLTECEEKAERLAQFLDAVEERAKAGVDAKEAFSLARQIEESELNAIYEQLLLLGRPAFSLLPRHIEESLTELERHRQRLEQAAAALVQSAVLGLIPDEYSRRWEQAAAALVQSAEMPGKASPQPLRPGERVEKKVVKFPARAVPESVPLSFAADSSGAGGKERHRAAEVTTLLLVIFMIVGLPICLWKYNTSLAAAYPGKVFNVVARNDGQEGRAVGWMVQRDGGWDYHYKDPLSLMVVHEGDTVTLRLTSVDVVHNFFLPRYRIKETVYPGKVKVVTFIADRAGKFPYICHTYCGSGHEKMRGELVVLPKTA